MRQAAPPSATPVVLSMVRVVGCLLVVLALGIGARGLVASSPIPVTQWAMEALIAACR